MLVARRLRLQNARACNSLVDSMNEALSLIAYKSSLSLLIDDIWY